MKQPSRLRDDGSASPEVRALLAAAGPTRRLPKSVRERSAARLDRMLVVPAAAGTLALLKGIAVAAGVAAVTWVVPQALSTLKGHPTAVLSSSTAPVQSTTRLPRTTPSAMATPAAVRVASSASTVVAAAPPASSLPVGSERTSQDPLAREVMLLEKARAVLVQDPDAALAVLEIHRAEFLKGTLAMERELVAVDALSHAGRLDDARVRGRALLDAARGSIYEARVQSLLQSLDNR